VDRTVVVANAPFRWAPEFVALARAARYLVAADGGANHLARIGLRPHAVVGDLDSLLPSVRAWVGEERVVERPDQDTTDLHKALVYAVEELGAGALSVLAATGGRLDHALENLALLGRFCQRVALEFVDETARIVPVVAAARFQTQPGQTISLLPLGRCEGVSTEGLHWPLDGEVLDLLERTGVSNRATAQVVQVQVERGTLLVFLHHTAGAALASW
jgi:thiamine pyrophosphokinase